MKIQLVFAVVVIGAAMCASKPLHCRCPKIDSSLDTKLILSVKINKPNSFCGKKEVLVTLNTKDRRLVCIDPNGEFFTNFLIDLIRQSKKKSTLTTTGPAPAESSTAPAKSLQTPRLLTSTSTKHD
ncbi:hypothetical protein WMY93_014595 [Mugilogobius chulae]|uniref:Chemokine interleukin-8-like domain-containing protein n=1 Tax=Mugilogobius chulae TaxID=88201 RepID=A0AAW0P4U8_9GOBI